MREEGGKYVDKGSSRPAGGDSRHDPPVQPFMATPLPPPDHTNAAKRA